MYHVILSILNISKFLQLDNNDTIPVTVTVSFIKFHDIRKK